MNTQELLTFLTVSKVLSYQKASKKLQYAPSTLYKHIQHLETELGTSLFVREGRTLRLTSAGEQFLPYARHMLEEYLSALSCIGNNPLHM